MVTSNPAPPDPANGVAAAGRSLVETPTRAGRNPDSRWSNPRLALVESPTRAGGIPDSRWWNPRLALVVGLWAGVSGR
jgi:hypothetical protein